MTREEAHINADDDKLGYIAWHTLHEEIDEHYDKKEATQQDEGL